MTWLGVSHPCTGLAWPLEAMSAVVLAAALTALAFGLLRLGRGLRPLLGGLLAGVVAGGWLLASRLLGSAPSRLWPLALVVLCLLVAHLHRYGVTRRDAVPPSWRSAAAVVAAAVGLAVILLHDLSTFSGTLLVWETAVVEHFAEVVRQGTGALRFAAGNLLWEEGLVSRGQHSLVYGSLTYTLFRLFGASVITLRAASVVLAVASVVALYLFARRPFGETTAACAAVLLAASAPLWLYGRYGTLLAETIFGSVIAFGCAWLFLDRRGGIWPGAVCVAGFYLATLAYATARIVVVALLLLIIVAELTGPRTLASRRGVGLIVLLSGCGLVWAGQRHAGVASSFLSASGEQAFSCVVHAYHLERVLGRKVTPAKLTLADQVEVVEVMVRTTVPQYLANLARPFGPPLDPCKAVAADPPALPFVPAPLALLTLLGWAGSLRKPRSTAALSLTVVFVVTTGALLLTTRADPHRMLVLLLPIVLWTAVGVIEAGALARACGVPAALRRALPAIFVAAWVCENLVLMFHPAAPDPRLANEIAAALASTNGPVAVAPRYGVEGHDLDFREIGRVNLALIDRMVGDATARGKLLTPDEVDGLLQSPPGADAAAFTLLRSETLFLVPAVAFDDLVARLQARGLRAVRGGPPGTGYWRVDRMTTRRGGVVGAVASGGAGISRLSPP